jgi:hypothetical protein
MCATCEPIGAISFGIGATCAAIDGIADAAL